MKHAVKILAVNIVLAMAAWAIVGFGIYAMSVGVHAIVNEIVRVTQ